MAGESNNRVVPVAVPSKDPAEKKAEQTSKKDKKSETEMTEEDKKLKQDIDLLVERVQDSDPGIVSTALQTLTSQLQEAASSMTSVPKPLKFLIPHLDTLVTHFLTLPQSSPSRGDYAMILSVISTTCADSRRLCLHFCLESGSQNISLWGYAYLRTLSGQIADAYQEIQNPVDVNTAENEKTKTEDANVPSTTAAKDKESGNEANKTAKNTPSKAICPLLKVPLPKTEQLLHLVIKLIVPFYMTHNAEIDAVDLLAEVDQVAEISKHLDANNYQRVVLYILGLANYSSSSDEYAGMLRVACDAFLQQENYYDAMRVAIKINKPEMIKSVLDACKDKQMLSQLALLLARQSYTFEFEEESLQRLNSNEKQSKFFRRLAKELDVLEPKEPEDVYKTHLEDKARRPRMVALDSAMQNLASTFVNALVNAGFGTDKLMTVEGSNWIFKNKDHGMLSASASIGAICLWNMDEALALLDRHQYSTDPHVKAGALLGFGLASCNVRHECDAALALLKEHLESSETSSDAAIAKLAATVGIACAYAGTNRDDVMELLTVFVLDGSLPIESAGIAAISLGLCFVGSANQEAAEAILTALMDRSTVEKGLDSPFAHFLSLGLGLLFLGTRDASEAVLLALQAVPCEWFASASQLIVEGLAAAGSGDVLKVQKMLSICGEKREASYWKDKAIASQNAELAEASGEISEETCANSSGTNNNTNSTNNTNDTNNNAEQSDPSAVAAAEEQNDQDDNEEHRQDFDQAVAVLNVALLSFSEEIGSGMCLRMMDHILQYGGIHQRRAVPLALALHSPSNPRPNLIDLLSKLSHDNDATVALNAIFAMGIVGAGTNHSRIASLLRQLATYYGKDASALFVLRISQGLLHMGKGLLTINPIHSDRTLINNVAFGSLITIIYTCMHIRETILGRYHYLLYLIFPAIHPRWMITVADSHDQEMMKAMEKSHSHESVNANSTNQQENQTDSAVCTEDEDLSMIGISVRVGEAVDIVGQVGRQPKTITAFQTHNSPVLLSFTDRVELTTDEYMPLARVLEGIVIVKKNPNYTAPKE